MPRGSVALFNAEVLLCPAVPSVAVAVAAAVAVAVAEAVTHLTVTVQILDRFER